MKKNEIITLEISDMTNLGFGVGKHEGMVVFVSDAVIGDTLEAKIIKITSSYAVAKLERLIIPSNERTEPRCKERLCHSCAYKSVSYGCELRIKRNDVISAFKKSGLPDVIVNETLPSPKLLNYRNKAQYPISMDKNGEYIVGFYAPKTHRVTEARNCPLAPKEFPEILSTLTAFFKRYKLSVYDEQSGKGLLRHIYLRRGEVSHEIMLTIVINANSLPHAEELAALIKEKHKEIKCLLLNVNCENTNIILGKEYITLFGDGFIKDTLAGVELKLTAPSFYQVNHECAELLYAKAKELAAPTKEDVILDIYCGVGSIGLSMAKNAKELIGIEIVESAVEMARENAENAGFNNAKFYTGDAINTERLLSNAENELKRKIKPSIIILDPPRAGCAEDLIKFCVSLSPSRIVYISCNPQTLARDAKLFENLGYSCGEVYPVDMFPGTGHVETIVCLCKQ